MADRQALTPGICTAFQHTASPVLRTHSNDPMQPAGHGPDAHAVAKTLDHIGDDGILLFASDFPHWHFDGDDPWPPGLSEDLVRKIAVDNAMATYPRLKESLP